jgi:phage repressor protein C with HTH and peptisase S24 domain
MIKSDNEDYKKRIIEKEDLNSLRIIGEIVGLMRDLRG